MSKTFVYDLPTRTFHFLFASLFLISFFIGNFIDDESTLYAYHMLSGILMALMVILRLFWGFLGTRYALFKSFKLNPGELKEYFCSVVNGNTKRELGHNPASSYAAVIMFILTFMLVGTGLLMVNRIAKDLLEEIHELFAFSFLIIVLLHIAGVLFHQLRHNDGMIFSMINGKKINIEGEEGISNLRTGVMVVFLLIVLGFAGNLLGNFNQKTGQLVIFGQTLKLGDNENEGDHDYDNEYYNNYYKMKGDHDDQDDD